MTEYDLKLFVLFAVYIPIALFIIGIVLLIIGIYLKLKRSLIYKRILFIGGIFLTIFFIIFVVIPFIIGMIGVGPGLSD